MTGIVDTHHHFWHARDHADIWTTDDHSRLVNNYTPDELRPLLWANRVEGTILVQSVNEVVENDRMAAFAREAPEVRGIVGYLPLYDRKQAFAELERSRVPHWCGARCLSDDPNLSWALSGDALCVLRHLAASGLSWDVVVRTRGEAETVARVSSMVPSLRIVVDHMCAPSLGTGVLEDWLQRIRLLSQYEAVSMKVSLGVAVLTPWKVWSSTVLDDRIGRVLELFSPDRLMFASNWPVSSLKAPYGTVVQDTVGALSRYLSGADLNAVTKYSALSNYQLAEL